MSVLRIYRGVPGSGKTTEALEKIKEGYLRVNRDDIRYSMFGQYTGVDEGIVTDVENMMVESALRANRDVLLDATNLSMTFLKTKLSLASRYDAGVEFVDFNVSEDEAIRRDAVREKSVGADVIRAFFKRYKINRESGVLPKPPTPLPDFAKYERRIGKPHAYIVDTDGTVADSDGVRSPYDTSRYHMDKKRDHIIGLVTALNKAGTAVVALSGRDAAYRDVTEQWWRDAGLDFTEFLMRPEGDKRMDAIIKYELFKDYIEPNYNVCAAIDDRQQVIRMWRSIGVPVIDVGHGVEF